MVKYFFIHPNWLSYRGCGVLVLKLQEIHRSDHALHGHEDVLKDQLDETTLVVFRVTRSMNDPHLFYKCRFPRFSCAWKMSKKKIAIISLQNFQEYLSFHHILTFEKKISFNNWFHLEHFVYAKQKEFIPTYTKGSIRFRFSRNFSTSSVKYEHSVSQNISVRYLYLQHSPFRLKKRYVVSFCLNVYQLIFQKYSAYLFLELTRTL